MRSPSSPYTEYGGNPRTNVGPSSCPVSTGSFGVMLLGTSHIGVPGAWWEDSEGAAVAGLLRLVASPCPSFLFVLGFVLAVAPAYVVCGVVFVRLSVGSLLYL